MHQQDAGEGDDVQRVLDPEQAQRYREQFLDGPFRQAVAGVFAAKSDVQSVTVLVGQYWCDEAIDAVQVNMVYSQLPTPDLDAAGAAWRDEASDRVNLVAGSQWDVVPDFKKNPVRHWDANGFSIPLFAAFCVEGGHQEGEGYEFDSPLAIYRRTDPKSVEVEFVGEMIRPWLDGAAYGGVAASQFDLAAFERWVTKGV